jgi:hypothetical protein
MFTSKFMPAVKNSKNNTNKGKRGRPKRRNNRQSETEHSQFVFDSDCEEENVLGKKLSYGGSSYLLNSETKDVYSYDIGSSGGNDYIGTYNDGHISYSTSSSSAFSLEDY